MNTVSIGVNLICIGIVLAAVLVSAVAFILGKIKKNLRIFHKTVEFIDLLLFMFAVFTFILMIASIAALMLINSSSLMSIDGMIIPMFLLLCIFIYLILKEVFYHSVSNLFKSKTLVPGKEKIKKQCKLS